MYFLNQFVFGIYPYIALSIFAIGCLVRFEREQYSWRSESTQILHKKYLRVGNICFHIGIIGLFFGHLVGLLTPISFWDHLGISHGAKQLFAIVAGGVMGLLCLFGLICLLIRRFSSERLKANTSWRDKLVLGWLLVTLLLGLSTIFVSSNHLDGHEMVLLMNWAQHIVTFRSGAADLIIHTNWLFKLHLFMGISVFVLFPFSRLVHIWSGFGTTSYLFRRWQLVRPRSKTMSK